MAVAADESAEAQTICGRGEDVEDRLVAGSRFSSASRENVALFGVRRSSATEAVESLTSPQAGLKSLGLQVVQQGLCQWLPMRTTASDSGVFSKWARAVVST